MATVSKVTRRARGKTYTYFAVRFIDPGSGKEKLRYFSSLKEAKKACTAIDSRIEVGRYNDESHRLTVRELVKRFREANYFPRGEGALRSTTIALYETALGRILERWGNVRAIDVRASAVDAWRDEMLAAGEGRAPVAKALMVMGRLFRFAIRDHIVTTNPVADVAKPAVRARKAADERLTPEQLVALFAAVKGRTRVIVRIGAGTGLREGEIFGLRWRDVDLEAKVIHVRGQYTHGEFVEHAKTDAGARTVPMDGDLARCITEWKLAQKPEHKQPDSLVVSSSRGGPLSASNFLAREFYPALEAAELPRVVFHSLRHTFKTILVSSSNPQAVVHTVLGHANFSTTLKLYGGITDDSLESVRTAVADALTLKRPDKQRTNA